jgi:hypothetical protein
LANRPAHVAVRGHANALVQLTLVVTELDRAHDLGLGRQIFGDALLHSAQNEG